MNPPPPRRDPFLNEDQKTVELAWYRWFQQAAVSAATPGPPGPPGPPSTVPGPPGPSGLANDTLGMLALSALSSSVTSVTSTTADLTVANPYGDVRLTVVSAPKWDTPRTLSFTGDATGTGNVDGSTNVATGLTLATVNANTGTWGDSAHVGQFTVNAKGLITAASSVAILPTLSHLTNQLSGNVAMNNTALVFDGPTVAQGTVGTWMVFGTVTVEDTAGAASIVAQLWDGTTIIASTGITTTVGANDLWPISLSGVITSPAGNLRISCQDFTSIHGIIVAAGAGGNTASTITAIRIG